MIKLRVAREKAGLRLDRFLALALPDYSRSRLQELIRLGLVRLNDRQTRPRSTIQAGDLIRLTEPSPEKIEDMPEAMTLDVLFEDDELLVINKVAGLVVHPGAGHREHTLVNALLHHCPNLSGIGGKQRPGIVHRLDKETSGCLVIAKNDMTHQSLARQFASRTVLKLYLALVTGALKQTRGIIDAPIARHSVHRKKMAVAPGRGRTAKTDYRVLRSSPRASLVECSLHTGRTHQVRVHLHHLGHPVLGDTVYAPKAKMNYPRQMLHAWKLGFHHPRSEQWREFEAPLPNDFVEALRETIGVSPSEIRPDLR
ncbi:MAG: RluA family pseudouridine synthase [Verrucomicrobiota bacterium]